MRSWNVNLRNERWHIAKVAPVPKENVTTAHKGSVPKASRIPNA